MRRERRLRWVGWLTWSPSGLCGALPAAVCGIGIRRVRVSRPPSRLAPALPQGKLAQIRSVRLCGGGGTWARWRQANRAKQAHLPRRTEEMDRPRLAHQPLVAGQRAVGHHRQPRRGELPRLPRRAGATGRPRCGRVPRRRTRRGSRPVRFGSRPACGFPRRGRPRRPIPAAAPRPSAPCARRRSAARRSRFRNVVAAVVTNVIGFALRNRKRRLSTSPLSTTPAPTAPCGDRAGGG